LLRSLTTLKPQQRAALSLPLAGYSYREIMERLGVTYTWINRRVTEVRQALRRAAAEAEVAPRPAASRRARNPGGHARIRRGREGRAPERRSRPALCGDPAWPLLDETDTCFGVGSVRLHEVDLDPCVAKHSPGRLRQFRSFDQHDSAPGAIRA
jgi:hypothetical protein